jgi:hypothetical protein
MYQVKVYSRQDDSLIMESDVFDEMAQADYYARRVGQGEGYYTLVMKLDAVWSDLTNA